VIELQSVTVAYGGRPLVEDLSLSVAAGEHIALMAPSGWGKTSLLNLMAGLLSPTAGHVLVDRSPMGYVFQEPRLLPWLTAAENVNLVLSDHKKTLPQAEAWLERVGLGADKDKYPHELSGGMQQRVNLARALAVEGDILLLDEPLKGLDQACKQAMLTLLQTHSQGKTLVLATHDAQEAAALTERVYRFGIDKARDNVVY
jgi:NitT/TauT family transport system ATP-binding protein